MTGCQFWQGSVAATGVPSCFRRGESALFAGAFEQA